MSAHIYADTSILRFTVSGKMTLPGAYGPLTHYLDDGNLPVDNNWVENRIRPIALGRSNWLFTASLRAGQAPLPS